MMGICVSCNCEMNDKVFRNATAKISAFIDGEDVV